MVLQQDHEVFEGIILGDAQLGAGFEWAVG